MYLEVSPCSSHNARGQTCSQSLVKLCRVSQGLGWYHHTVQLKPWKHLGLFLIVDKSHCFTLIKITHSPFNTWQWPNIPNKNCFFENCNQFQLSHLANFSVSQKKTFVESRGGIQKKLTRLIFTLKIVSPSGIWI